MIRIYPQFIHNWFIIN